MTAEDPKAEIRDQALALGFDAVGFAPADLGGVAAERLRRFLAEGLQGDMGWLAERSEQRGEPKALWPDAKSVIVLAQNYGPEEDPLATLEEPEQATVSVYARNRDYHDLVKKRLKQLGRWMAERYGCQLKVFVDTAPVMEKPLAEKAGVGWQGKHTNLVSREFGSWLFLGEIFCELELAPDPPEADHCGSCRACLDVCPTDAFPAPYRLDARRCISYLTIEHKGPIERSLRPLMGNRIYGCDDCLAVCPWNKFAQDAREQQLQAREALKAPRLEDLAALDDTAFRALFTKSAVKRLGRDRFVRNVLYAIGNSGDSGMIPTVRARLMDEAAVVRGAAVWALSRLAAPDAFAAERALALPAEIDEGVRAEWGPSPA
ncbi:tRNA epoxyqueuosine(34) reductase QueG [Phenylobacterium sp.]|uniref:tRNA epoxyqueuosine(34) reductase QueG n=1 Tax=Phenylobacterium sp. TaxID=1871053 RepID=UPI00262FC33F|nr:tRNA epoxyqueuosine(34) reductase QueG [Phenylobacterium sp.]